MKYKSTLFIIHLKRMCKQCSRSVCILFSEVLVGEYTLAQDPDCQGSFCLPSPQHLNIEKVIPHEDWSEENFKQGHDIALIRVQNRCFDSVCEYFIIRAKIQSPLFHPFVYPGI